MKVYRIIVIVFAVILGLFTVVGLCGAGAAELAIKEPVTEEYYELLKENALKVAKTLDKAALDNETLTADFYFKEDKLVVTVESIKAKIIANIPISNYSLNAENGTMMLQGTLDFENAKYIEKNLLMPAWFYIFLSVVWGMFVGVVVYIVFFYVWFSRPKRQLLF